MGLKVAPGVESLRPTSPATPNSSAVWYPHLVFPHPQNTSEGEEITMRHASTIDDEDHGFSVCEDKSSTPARAPGDCDKSYWVDNIAALVESAAPGATHPIQRKKG